MGNEFVNLQFSGQVVIHKIWQLGSAFDTTERATLPYSPGHQLERWMPVSPGSQKISSALLTSCGDLLSCRSHSDDNALAPALVTCL